MSCESFSPVNPKIPAGSKKRTRASFTPEENLLLKMLVQMHGTSSWDTIASKMIGRTARQCKERWFSYLAPTISNAPWTPYEDERLKYLASVYNKKWVIIARFFPGRSDSQVKNRWYTHVEHRRSRNIPTPVDFTVDSIPEVDLDDCYFEAGFDTFTDIEVL